MAMETQISELMREDTVDANKILDSLLDPKNIDLKTHICDPVTFALFQSLVDNFEKLAMLEKHTKKQLPITDKLLKDICDDLKNFLVSWNRESRKEITETLKATKQEDAGAKSLFRTIAGM